MEHDRERDTLSRPGRTETIDPESEEQRPYDEGEISPWYGADTGMGEEGTSQEGEPSATR